MKTTLLYLMRHGTTEWNVSKGRYCGSGEISDIGLNPMGVKQAKALSERLKDAPLKAVYSSPMKRAVQTAEWLARPHRLGVIIMDGLRERSYGRWEGLTVDEINKRFPGSYQRYQEDPGSFRPPDGETGLEVGKRVVQTVGPIAGNHQGCAVALVSHEATNRILLCQLLGLSISHYRRRLVQSNAALTIVEYSQGQGRLLLYNDTSHLCRLK